MLALGDTIWSWNWSQHATRSALSLVHIGGGGLQLAPKVHGAKEIFSSGYNVVVPYKYFLFAKIMNS